MITWYIKDDLPPPGFYNLKQLSEPRQTRTFDQPFDTFVEDQQYHIKPLFDYELDGVVISLHDADSIADIWHHDKWKDFINVRDLCVIWGANVANDVYRDMSFKNDSWTCWAYWPDQATAKRFQIMQLSNNHILVDDKQIKQALMNAELGDQVHFSGVLASYSNPGNGFQRGSSTNRSDTGNGACETVYLHDFQIVRKANAGMRILYTIAGWTIFLSVAVRMLLLFTTPTTLSPRDKRRYRRR